MFGSGKPQKSGIKISGAHRPADGFPRFTEDFLSPPSAEVGCWKVHQAECYSSRQTDFGAAVAAAAAGSWEDPEAPVALTAMALGPGQAAAVRSKTAKGVANLAKGRAASKVFSLTESEGDSTRAMHGDEPVSSSDSEPHYLSRVAQVKALATKKGRLSEIGSRDLNQLQGRTVLHASDESHESLSAISAGISRILSYDRHSYMESPRQMSQEFQAPRSPDAINFTTLAWKRGKKFRRAPLVNFSRCTFSCAGNVRALRSLDSLPKQPAEVYAYDAHQGRATEEEVGDGRVAGSDSSSNGNSLRRSFRWLYSKVKAMGNESPEADPRGGSDISPEVNQRAVDSEWKKLAMEQSERMSSMLDVLRSIATKLDGIAVKDILGESPQQSSRGFSGRQPDKLSPAADRISSAKESSRQNTFDRRESSSCLGESTDKTDKNSKSRKSGPRHSGPTLLSLSNCVRDARVFLRNFSELIGKETNEGTHKNLILGELLPRVHFVKPWHLRYGLEAFVCEVFFADFEREGFGTMDGVPEEILLTPDEYLVQFQSLASMEPQDATDAGHPDYDPNFHWFCELKLQIIQEKVYWIREWSNDLLDTFLDAAKHVWRLHMLAFSFSSPAEIIRAAESEVFNSEEMEPVDDADGLIMDAKAFCSRVELTVMPGFRLPEGTVRCKVYLKPKSARTDNKKSPRAL